MKEPTLGALVRVAAGARYVVYENTCVDAGTASEPPTLYVRPGPMGQDDGVARGIALMEEVEDEEGLRFVAVIPGDRDEPNLLVFRRESPQ